MGRWSKLQRLRVRLLVTHLLVSVVPVLTVIWVGLPLVQRGMEAAVLKGHQEIARRAAREVLYFVYQPLGSLQGLALAMQTERAAWQRQSLLSRASLDLEAVGEVFLLDPAGNVEASSVLDPQAPLGSGRPVPARYLPDETGLWDAVRQQRRYFSGLVFRSDQPSLIVALPVQEGSALAGALVARLNLYQLWQMMDQIKVDQSGRGVLLDSSGRYLACPAREWVYQGRRHLQADRLQGPETGALRWQDQEGVAWMGGYARLDDLGWTVVVEQQANEALGLTLLLRQRLGWLVGLSGLTAVGLGLILLRSITHPLDRLMQAVRQMQEGKRPELILSRRKDEIQALGGAFLGMAQALAARQQDLETALAFQERLIAHNPLALAVVDGCYEVVQANQGWKSLVKEEEPPPYSLAHSPRGARVKAWLVEHPEERAGPVRIDDPESRGQFWFLRKVDLGEVYPGGVLLVLEDQTEQRLLGLRLAQQEKLAALGQMAAGVAHEIKNPLAIMQNACDLLKRLEPGEAERQRRVLDLLEGAIRRVDERVGNLLDFTCPARQAQEPLDVVALLRQLVDLEQLHLEQQGIGCAADLQPVPLVYLNQDVLKDVFLNLLTNACEAMPSGGQLRVSTALEDNWVVVHIRDTGPGIPPERLQYLFTPFFSTKPPGQGTGLGLALAYRQVREADGEIRVVSEPGKGACFSVYLPAWNAKESI